MLFGNGFDRLVQNKEQLGHFVNIYNKLPDQFKKEYEGDFEDIALTNKNYVIIVSCYEENEKCKMPLQIYGIYKKEKHHKSKLMYRGHIAFIDVCKQDGEIIEVLCKDDECYPQSFDDFCEDAIWEDEDYPNFNKQVFYDMVLTTLRYIEEDPYLEVEASDIIILQGL